MLSQVHYLIRSAKDGQYLVAHLRENEDETEAEKSYLFLFREHYDALSYLNTHASDLAGKFAVESIAPTQLKGIIKRWGFNGIALVTEPITPQIQFLSYEL